MCKCSRGAKSRSRRSTGLCLGEQQRLVGFISKERGVIELEEDEAEGGGTKALAADEQVHVHV